MKSSTVLLAFAYAAINHVNAQTFQRLGTCPKLGCVFPPDQAEFYPGQLFDIRLEVHAPVNGTEAFNDGKPDQSFKFEILQGEDENGKGQGVTQFFNIQDSELESWDFSYVYPSHYNPTWQRIDFRRCHGFSGTMRICSRNSRTSQLSSMSPLKPTALLVALHSHLHPPLSTCPSPFPTTTFNCLNEMLLLILIFTYADAASTLPSSFLI